MKYVRFYGTNGYNNCDYENFLSFEEDEYDEDDLNEMSIEYARENAETFEYVALGGWENEWESQQEEDEYYENALMYSGWEYITKEIYMENINEEF